MTTITKLPPVPSPDDPDNFDDEADAFVAALPQMAAEMNQSNAESAGYAKSASDSAKAAAQSVIDANTAKNDAQQARTDAQQARTDAQTAKTQAETARTQAQTAATTLRGTSANALTISVGFKSLTTQAGRQFDPGQTLKFLVNGNGEAWMSGRVDAYNSATGALTVNVRTVAAAYAGQGSNNWNIYVSGEDGPPGPMGGLSGGNATGAINEARAANVTSTVSPVDIWSGAGNLIDLTGAGTVTGFTNAPQAGARRTLIVSGTPTLVTSASMIVYGGTQSLVPGDLVDVVAGSTTEFRVTVRKRDGTPTVHNQGAFHNLRTFGYSSVFTASKTGWHKITVAGSSGTGGLASTLSDGQAGATGAGAGAIVSGMRYLTAGVSYAVTVGAGPAGKSTGGGATPVALDGEDGNTSTFSGTGIVSLTAYGGGKGYATVTAGTELSGGVGGNPAGDGSDMKVSGGNGGYLRPLGAGAVAATGGGSVGIQGVGRRGGDASATASGGNAAGGGAGVGGRGGDAICTTSNNGIAAGGGSAGPAADVTNTVASSAGQAGYNFAGVNGADATAYPPPNELEWATGGGQVAEATGNAPSGGGSGGRGSSANAASDSRAGIFAGGGGVAARNITLGSHMGGACGGAPGGVVVTAQPGSTTIRNITGPNGSAGRVWVEW